MKISSNHELPILYLVYHVLIKIERPLLLQVHANAHPTPGFGAGRRYGKNSSFPAGRGA